MTPSSPSPEAAPASNESRDSAVLALPGLGACLRRAALPVVALAVVAALGSGLWVVGEAKTPALLGIAAGLLATAVALVLEARALCAPARDRAAGLHFQVALALGFAVLFVSLCGSVLTLHLAGVKFAIWSAFALAFAGSAFVLHVAGALVLMRARSSSTSSATSACRAA